MTAVTTLPFSIDGWTVDDLYLLPDDDRFRYELVDGALLMTPPPVLHGHAVAALSKVLGQAVPESWCVLADSGVRFDDRNYRRPDVFVVARSALHKKLAAPADVLLAVEVMSPSSVSNDRVSKPAQYADAGMPHYWRVELEDQPVLFTYSPDGDVYRETGRFTVDVSLTEPVELTFSLRELLAS